ncbi:MAG: FAD-binding protein, partial [Pyrinomonadaceae bacterium]
MNLINLTKQASKEVDLNKTYDAVIVGSGAAGGMAAHVLTSHGLNCLMLEAGRKLDIDNELKSMEWPYDHPRRGDIPYDTHSLTFNEYNIRDRPYAKESPYKELFSYIGNRDANKNIVVNEKEHPYTGTKYAWVRARLLGGKTNIWGRVALRFSDYDFKGRTHDGYGEDWPLSYVDIAPYYDKVDLYLGISGQKENLPQLPDSIYQRPIRLTWAEYKMRERLAKIGRVLTPTRVGVATDGVKHNKY